MTTIQVIYFIAVTALVGLATWSECSGLRLRINGASGFIWFNALVLSVMGLAGISIATWLLSDLWSAFRFLVAAVIYLAVIGYASLKRMDSVEKRSRQTGGKTF